jgi:hypothetical protein
VGRGPWVARVDLLPWSADKLYVFLFLHGLARCSVRSEDCGPRREGNRCPFRSGRVRRDRRLPQLRPGPWRLHTAAEHTLKRSCGM